MRLGVIEGAKGTGGAWKGDAEHPAKKEEAQSAGRRSKR